MKNVDERYITYEWLDRHFPVEHQPDSRLYRHKQEELYLQFREKINYWRRLSGHIPLCDADFAMILDEYIKK